MSHILHRAIGGGLPIAASGLGAAVDDALA